MKVTEENFGKTYIQKHRRLVSPTEIRTFLHAHYTNPFLAEIKISQLNFVAGIIRARRGCRKVL